MSKEEILEIINSDQKGYHTGNRMIFPFKCNFIKIIADSHIMTEFKKSDDITISQEPMNTSLYFREIGRLKEFESGYKYIKIVLASYQDDLSNPENHIKLVCKILENHRVEFEVPSDDVLFIV